MKLDKEKVEAKLQGLVEAREAEISELEKEDKDDDKRYKADVLATVASRVKRLSDLREEVKKAQTSEQVREAIRQARPSENWPVFPYEERAQKVRALRRTVETAKRELEVLELAAGPTVNVTLRSSLSWLLGLEF